MRCFNWYWKNATFWGHFLTIRVMSHAFASLSLRIPEFSKTKTLFSQVVNCRCSFLTKKTSKKHLWMPGWTYFSCSYRWPYCWLWIFLSTFYRGINVCHLYPLQMKLCPQCSRGLIWPHFVFLLEYIWIHLSYISTWKQFFWDVFTLDSYLCTLHTKCIQTRYILHSNIQMYL